MRVSIRLETPASQGIVSTCLLIAAWAYANISSLKWLFESFREASPLNLMLICFVVVVLLVQVVRVRRGGGWEIRDYFSTTPILRSRPLLLMIGSAISAIALHWLIDIEQLTVLLFLLGTYGLCGLFLAPPVWRQGLPFASLIACIVPFSSQVSIGLGLPARILTAHAVEQLLSAWHIAAISSYDIIVLENGVAHVDVPCSGLKSLWIGTLFLLAATWLENRKLGARWLLVCCSNLGVLTLANTVRVLVLVVVTHVLQQPQFARMLHIPLGLLGICCACALSWVLLQRVPKQGEQSNAVGAGFTDNTGYQQTPSLNPPSSKLGSRFTRMSRLARDVVSLNPPSSKPGSRRAEDCLLSSTSQLAIDSRRPTSPAAQALLLVFVVTLALISQLYAPQEEQPLSVASLHWPEQMVTERIPLTAAEHRFFDNYPSLVPEKQRFVSGDLSGSILVVANTTWRTYHPPEMCLLAIGLKVDRIERKQLTSAVQARWMSLVDGKLSAAYWFQSPKQTTDDFLSRLWSDVTRRQKNWVLVSVLFDSFLSPDSSEIRDFATTIHDAIDHSLEVGSRKAGEQHSHSRLPNPPTLGGTKP